jgi:hypothetical protein
MSLMRNRWQDAETSAHHPYPGTFPVILTDENDWGGWRVPGAEYDRDPGKIEHQARLIMNAPSMLRQIRIFVKYASEQPQDLPSDLVEQAKAFSSILRDVYHMPPTQADATSVAAE